MDTNNNIPDVAADESIPKEFRQIMRDFLRDLFNTFPEYKSPSLENIILNDEAPLEDLFQHIKSVFPHRFFDILYKNSEIFADDEKNTEFLPGINFAEIWKIEDISDTTRETIWKYLQLVMFSVLETLNSDDSFGDTAKLFEAINEDELKSKIEETVEQMKDLFSNVDDSNSSEGINLEDLPNPESVHNHLNGLLDGKLGKLAAEIAEETAKDFEVDLNTEGGDVGDMFKKLFKNPGKLMGLVNNISTKLDTKMKNGDIKESDLMKEASDLMSKMKNMPGMPNIEELMKTMNVPKNKKGMMKHQFNQNMRTNGTKERLRKKLELRQREQEKSLEQSSQSGVSQDGSNSTIEFNGKSFSDGSKVKRSKAKKGKKK
tara:strand:+ start:1837 stop:2958 length:1122 start_codon:yes stop_codon:yes gene_type:complete